MRALNVFALGIVALALASGRADALTCYVILDRNDTVLYQDAVPPVDMSDDGAIARSDLRRRGEFLMMLDSDRCPRYVAPTGPATGAAAVEEIVAGMRSYGGASAGVRPTGRAAPGLRRHRRLGAAAARHPPPGSDAAMTIHHGTALRHTSARARGCARPCLSPRT